MKISDYTDGAFGTESVADFLDRIVRLLREGKLGVSEMGVKPYDVLGYAAVSFKLTLTEDEES